ncbi:MAG: cardiolipin synthase [Clostridia bacterium]|nr:cardiolipin synthase [Clostridia bacterium]
MKELSTWLIIGYVINFILVIVLVGFERRDPVVALAWVLAFTLLPIAGAIIFLFFGKGLKSYTRRKYALKAQRDEEYSRILKKQHEIFRTRESERPYTDIIRYLLAVNQSIYTDDNHVKIFTDAAEKYNSLFCDIENAKETINLLYFIIRNDETGRKLLSLLEKKAREGVEVRLLYDDFGSILTPKRIFNGLKRAGGKVHLFFPVKLGSLLKINHRNHRKIVVVDGKIAYMGGMNIGDEYMGKKKPSPWRDTHIKVQGSAVYFLQERFAMDWLYATNEDLSNQFKKFFTHTTFAGDVGMQIVTSGPDSKSEEIKCGMIKMINEAKRYIYIQTPYFVPDKPFLEAMRMAAASGVDVRIMLPGIPDKRYVYYTSLSYVGEMLDAGISVYLYPGFIHSKTIVADDTVSTIGTTNIDIRSFQLHFEINAFMYDEDTAVECRKIFENDAEKCFVVTKEWYNRRGILQVLKEGFYRLFSPIM